jgi:hypothetical protein
MMATTIINSIKVKPCWTFCVGNFIVIFPLLIKVRVKVCVLVCYAIAKAVSVPSFLVNAKKLFDAGVCGC